LAKSRPHSEEARSNSKEMKTGMDVATKREKIANL
jgi:hypothetical protein